MIANQVILDDRLDDVLHASGHVSGQMNLQCLPLVRSIHRIFGYRHTLGIPLPVQLFQGRKHGLIDAQKGHLLTVQTDGHFHGVMRR